MRRTDAYETSVEWSHEDKTYIGRCPDLITGIHGDDPVRLYAELCETVDDVIKHFEQERRPLPQPRVREADTARDRITPTEPRTAQEVGGISGR